jgi:hypothetical protein
MGYELFKAFQRQHSLFRVEWVYPRTEDLFVQNCKDLTGEISRALFTEGVTLYALNIGSCHWVLLLIDSRQGASKESSVSPCPFPKRFLDIFLM